MGTTHSIESDLLYVRKLVGAGLDGISSARQEFDGRGVFTAASKTAVWMPAAIGAGIGMLSTSLGGNRKSRSTLAMGGLVGSVLGLGAAAAWAARGFTGVAARNATRLVNGVRDARWLEKNPIDYA